MSILEEFWRGNITPNERGVKPESAYQRLNSALCADEKRLIESLSADARESYDSLSRKHAELAGMSELDTFIVGFRLGTRIMLEVTGKYDIQLPQIGEAG